VADVPSGYGARPVSVSAQDLAAVRQACSTLLLLPGRNILSIHVFLAPATPICSRYGRNII
jgi:hypothetical protein